MTDKMMRSSDWPDRMRPHDPVKQLFDRVFEKRPSHDLSIPDPGGIVYRWIPQVDIKEETHRFVLYVDAPGVAPDAVEVSMNQGVLVIKGERKTDSQEGRESFLRIERGHGVFHRCFALPASANPRGITITARDGILYIIVRKHSDDASHCSRAETTRANESTGVDNLLSALPRAS